MNEQENIRRLRNRNIFEEIKKIVTPIKDTKKEVEILELETYETIIEDVFGGD